MRVGRRDCEPDCCTRVLRRSTGWRRTAEVKPEPRPATRWNAVRWRLVLAGSVLSKVQGGGAREAVLVDDEGRLPPFDILRVRRLCLTCGENLIEHAAGEWRVWGRFQERRRDVEVCGDGKMSRRKPRGG